GQNRAARDDLVENAGEGNGGDQSHRVLRCCHPVVAPVHPAKLSQHPCSFRSSPPGAACGDELSPPATCRPEAVQDLWTDPSTVDGEANLSEPCGRCARLSTAGAVIHRSRS